MKYLILVFTFMLTTVYGKHLMQEVNFYHEGDVSRFEITLDDAENVKAKRYHITEDKQIIIDVKDIDAGFKVLRGIDASEFSGSVVYINVYKRPGSNSDIRIAIQLRDNVRSLLTKEKNKLVLSIENRFGAFSQKKIKESKKSNSEVVASSYKINSPKSKNLDDILHNLTLSGAKKYVGKKISIDVQGLAVTEILKMIADTSGFNLILDDEVRKAKPLSLTLTNVPWDQALDTVMTLSKLSARKNSNILMVTTIAKATQERVEEAKMNEVTLKQEPLVTKIFPISYAKIADMEKILKDYLTENRGKISTDDRTNMLIVRDTIDTIERMKKIVATLDTQTPQILIESKIVEATEGFSQNIGLQRGLSFGYDPIGTPPDTGTGPGFSFSSVSQALDSTGAATNTFAGMQIGVLRRLTNLDLTLQLMETESKARIVSSPKVITQNKEKASLSSTSTTSFLVQTATATGTTVSFQEVSAALNLEVTPQVTNEGSISMEISLVKESFGERPSASAPPNTVQRDVKTNVLVDNGSTVVIGGLYTVEKSETVTGVPFLKNIPILGWLFRSAYAPIERKEELIIFLTPRIINQEEAGLIDRETKKS